MRYELKNLGPGNFYFVEVARLLKPGDSVKTGRLDEGTRRLADGPKPRLQIVDLEDAPTAAPATPKAEPTPTASGKSKDSPKPPRSSAQDTAPAVSDAAATELIK